MPTLHQALYYENKILKVSVLMEYILFRKRHVTNTYVNISIRYLMVVRIARIMYQGNRTENECVGRH